jgi:deoxyribodipyrimidine photo-lyase
MSISTFPTDLPSIQERIRQVAPVLYGKTRNYTQGKVTYLSPYISRGVISTKQVLDEVIIRGFQLHEIEAFVKELAWRDYFQRVWQEKDIDWDIKSPQFPVNQAKISKAIVEAQTGILGIDQAIRNLYQTGYMHNHCRMYVASLACNIARSYWKIPAKWMYYHLLDGDWASNACSWQWVAATNSSKKYYANQENISKHTGIHQTGTYLDKSYEELSILHPPQELQETMVPALNLVLPSSYSLVIDSELPTFLYTYYNLDPDWHAQSKGNRILLLEPSHFSKYPVSPKCIEFALALSKNIPQLQICVGEWTELQTILGQSPVHFKEHPFSRHLSGIEESRTWIVPEVQGYFPSFFAYWKKIEPLLKQQFSSYAGRKKTAFA